MARSNISLEPGFRSQCPHLDRCPGCPLIRSSYGQQLAHKSERVQKGLLGFFELRDVGVADTVPARQAEAYRTRAKLVVGPERKLGLYARGTHDVVDIPGCRVLQPALQRVAQTLRELELGNGLSGVDLALVSEQVMVTLIAEQSATREAMARLASELRARCTEVVSVALSRRAKDAVQLLGSQHEILSGPAELRVRSSGGASYHYAAHGAFLQVHADTASSIYAHIQQQVSPTRDSAPKVLELYAGSGALALSLAARGAQVTAVESFAPACERMERAAREQKLPLTVHAGDSAQVAAALASAGQSYDWVLVNPPRRGLDPEVRLAIAQLAPRELMYVSCNPATLARDLSHLARLGYGAEKLTPFDMMPLTDQVETLAHLTRQTPTAPEVLFAEDAVLAVHKMPHDALQASPRAEPSLLQRVRELPGHADAEPLLAYEDEMSGVCLFASAAQAVTLQESVQKAEATYVVLVKGVVHKKGRIERTLTVCGVARKVQIRFSRMRVVGGHSLVEVVCELALSSAIDALFASIGHPVIGTSQTRERATRAHFKMRHGLERAFIHCKQVLLPLSGTTRAVGAPLAADLGRVLESLTSR